MNRTRSIVFTALLAAIICVLAPLSVPAVPVPLSLATFAVLVASTAVSWKHGAAAVAVYILLGAVGAPVFAGFTGGAQRIFGVTGGYIIGYLPMALIAGALVDRFGGSFWVYPAAMAAGTLACYVCGTVWFVVQTGYTLKDALAVCVLPFLAGDAVKIAAASAVCPALRKTLKKQLKR